MRVYLPATLAMLMELNETGEFRAIGGTVDAGPTPDGGFGVIARIPLADPLLR